MNKFTTIGKGHGAPCFTATRESWEQARKDPRLAALCKQIEDTQNADEQKALKDRLPVWTPRCGEFLNNHRSQQDAIHCLNRQMFDIDEKGHTDEILAMMTPSQSHSQSQSPLYIGAFEILMIEESVRRGTHVLVVPPPGLTLDEAQYQFSQLINLPVDPAVKNVAGCIYMVPEDHVRYQSPKFFETEETALEPTSDGFAEGSINPLRGFSSDATRHSSSKLDSALAAPSVYRSNEGQHPIVFEAKPMVYRSNEGQHPTVFEAKPMVYRSDEGQHLQDVAMSGSNHLEARLQVGDNTLGDSGDSHRPSDECFSEGAVFVNKRSGFCQNKKEGYPDDYDGIPYNTLVEALADQLGGVPVHGSRNNFLFSMACHLRYVCNDDPRWIAQVLPTYGEDRLRVERTIQSACNRSQSRYMPQIVQRAISVARTQANILKLTETSEANKTSWNHYNTPTPPPMPKRLPKLIQLLVSKVDPMYRPAVAQAVFPPLGSHLHGVRIHYIDHSEADLGGFFSILMAKQSIGKGSINMPIDLIMEDICKRDESSRELERRWKQQCKSCKANEKRPARPEGLCVQYLMSNMTNAALVQRLIDAQAAGNKFLYVRLDEVELLNQIKASGGATASEIIRLAHNQALYGQERVSVESITGTPALRFNFNASTTIPAGQHFFAKGLTNGTISRLTFSTIIKPTGYRGIPRFGNYDEQFRQQLAPFISNLNAATGHIECRQAALMAERLCEENADIAELSDDDVFETLSYRACRIAHDKAILLYIAHDYQWDKSIADFCRWSMQYDMWLKLHFFGPQMHQLNTEQQMPTITGPQNMLDLLPDRFSLQDFQIVHRAQGKTGHIMQVIYTWVSRGYIKQDPTTQEYIKTKKYLSRHKSKPS